MVREMKDSGIEWVGIVPADWQVTTIKNGYNTVLGKMLCPNQRSEEDTLENYLCAANVKWNGLNTDVQKQMWFSPEEKQQLLVNKGDVLVMEGGMAGTACIYKGEFPSCYIQNSVHKCNGKHGNNNGFLYYWLFTSYHAGYIDSICNKATIQHYTGDKLSSTPMLLPTVKEQSRIVSLLDSECARIDDVIEQTRASIEEYKKLKQSIITEAVTKGIRKDRAMKDSGIEWIGEIPEDWKLSKVKYVSIFQPTCDTSMLSEDSEITYTPMDCIKNGFFINNAAQYGTVAASLTPYNDGDIVIAKVTPCFENGNIAVMENLYSGYGLGSSELFVLRPVGIETRYLFYWLQNELFMQQACSTMTGTGGLKRVSPYFVKNCPVTLPSEQEQKEIVHYLDEKTQAMDELVKKKDQFLTELENIKKSLIYEYVTGKKEVPVCQ